MCLRKRKYPWCLFCGVSASKLEVHILLVKYKIPRVLTTQRAYTSPLAPLDQPTARWEAPAIYSKLARCQIILSIRQLTYTNARSYMVKLPAYRRHAPDCPRCPEIPNNHYDEPPQ